MQSDNLLNNPENNSEPKIKQSSIALLALHKYVWSLVGIGLIFFATFMLAYWRVAKSKDFENQPVKSLTWQENQKSNLPYPEPKP